MLQLQPDTDIVQEYIKQQSSKYVFTFPFLFFIIVFRYLRALAALYFRMTAPDVEVYRVLEPLYNDYRKLRKRTLMDWEIVHMDEFIDELLTKESSCDQILHRLPSRLSLELSVCFPVCVSIISLLLT